VTRNLSPWAFVLLTSVACQLLKFALYGLANRHLTLRALVTTNGLPSLYAVTFGCLSTLVLRTTGYQSPLFIATFVFSGIILHDAVRVKGSMDRGGRAALLVAQSLEESRWLQQLRPLLGDRRHRPLHIAVGLALGVLAGLAWIPPVGPVD
jgi:acid phosphatase family membrane protein YuiD